MTGPPMTPEEQRIEGAIEAAIARGDFDDLPGSGEPLRLPSTHDPDWWIKERLEGDDVDRDALLPVVVLLRREHDQLEETLEALGTAQQVRDYLEDFNERVLADRAANPLARMLAPTVEVEERVAAWEAVHQEPEPAAAPEPVRRRRWWPWSG
ncbi:DnaJ family domain-containing protein [Brachybacterium hainanense]|uniref:DUF1992 domain-containing protein n=1 Tax=Brachybacterium hainanense TaxID=1541174 RepID=A0ABV6RF21_9MICO